MAITLQHNVQSPQAFFTDGTAVMAHLDEVVRLEG
jgi:hypothetical protein